MVKNIAQRIDLMSLSWFKRLPVGLLLLPLAYLSLKKITGYSWVIIFLAIFIYLVFTGIKTKIDTLKILTFNISAIFFALFLYESFLCFETISLPKGKSVQVSGGYATGGYIAPHPYLGYGANKDGEFTSKKAINNEVIYDVIYKIKDGLRYTPNSNDNSQSCALFFGCSFTFGEGLADASTLPFIFNQYAKQQYKIFNYGFHGYGPHQMLAYIENRVAKDIQPCKNKKIAIYSYLPDDHIGRAAGYSPWDQYGPNYEVIDGDLRKTGTFTRLPRFVKNNIMKSHIYKKLVLNRKPSHNDLIRTIEIIKESKELLLKDDVILYVFVWDNPKKALNNDYFFLEEMKKNNIKTFSLHDAIGDYDEKINTYIIHNDDKHPNGSANEKIASYLYLQLNDYNQIIKGK
jgi:hypothetical protein